MAKERKEKLIRVLQILQDTDENTPLNANQIIELLENEYLVGRVERRSIYRDVQLLQSCGYDIRQVTDRKKGWYMNKSDFKEWEIKILIDAIQQAKCISFNEAKNMKEKLLNLIGKRGRSKLTHMIIPSIHNLSVEKKIGNYISTLLEAIYQHKKIKFQYTEINNKMERVVRRNGAYYTLNLYTIYWSGTNYYLIGSHDHHEGLTHYRLDRIENIIMTEENIIEAKDKVGLNPELQIQEHIEKSVNHFQGESIRIKVEYFPNQVTNGILFDFVGEKIIVKQLENGKCQAIFTKMNSVTLVGWFMQYATMFQVISPISLRNDIIQTINKMKILYEK